MIKKLDKVQQAILLDLPIRFAYKNKIKHICEKYNIRVQSVLEYIFRVYFEDLRIFDTDFPSEL